jgi:DNA-binding IclR family transcriptional regulator
MGALSKNGVHGRYGLRFWLLSLGVKFLEGCHILESAFKHMGSL